MLDIPYYMSHHKEKMTSAVIREANRVYRLWCRNNPGFEDFGRVHLIAHSLGSVMAMEILSQQPTRVAKDIKLDPDQPSDKMFEFDTTNLFSCGSPSGFFLLLHNANLVPRKGRNKPGMDGEDRQPGIASEAKYGCLAVDNVYNIVHRNDPISYLQNSSVDDLYAKTLEVAAIPTATVGFVGRMSAHLPWSTSVAAGDDAYASHNSGTRPDLPHLPSTVEMETHNFSREEIAEKRMLLLNDNGQIDYFLAAGGGPLEFQYLNMLSAHSSYWLLQDFVRFLVVEIGREPGRNNTLPALKARKKRVYKRGNPAS
jgi:pimeloyl-ACP methyl ester carboxylesterase